MCAKDASRQPEWLRKLAGDFQRARAVRPAAILAATFIAYAATLGLGFVFDDHVLIVTNDSIRSWRYFPSYFTSHIWSFRYPHLLANYYRPFFLTWLRLNDMLFGLRPWGWHLTSVLAHLAATYLVYRLCLRLTSDAWVAIAAGLIFGLHPVHVEAVADITSMQEPLSTIFILGAMLSFCRSRDQGPRRRWLAASLFFTAAALLSKESGMVIPILVGGFAWIYGDASSREVSPVEIRFFPRLRSALVVSIPFWVVILIYVPVRIRALKGFAHVITPLSLSREVFTLPSVLLFYLRLLVSPVSLSCYYDLPYVSTATFRGFYLPLAGILAAAAVLGGWYVWTRRTMPDEARTLAFACLWMVVAIFPVLNFRMLPEGEIVHDRYLYLPSVGFSLLLGLAVVQWVRAHEQIRKRPAWVAGFAVFICMVTGFLTARQSLYWSDDLTLNFRAHRIAPHNVYATTSLGAAVAERGLDAQAMVLYQQALAIQPGFWRANVNLAHLYYAHENFPEAARYFARACAADPTDGDQFLYLGMSLLRMGRFTEAEKAIRTALLVRPQGKNYHLGLGMVLRAERRFGEAQREIEVELSQDGQNAQARTLLEEVTREMQAPSEKSSAEQGRNDRSTDIK
ncbi:MAG: tetratricopeptide repeat protein [Terriglobia bacterium]